MYKCNFEVTLTLQAPILTHTVDTLGFGIDMATRKYHNKPVLNGSLIRGNILHNLLYFAESLPKDNGESLTKDVYHWFGQEANSGVEAIRAKLNFDYFWKLDESSVSYSTNVDSVRYRIGIDDNSGTVESGNLQIIESCFATGEKPRFKGMITAWVNDENEFKRLERWLNKAFQYITAIGALKGAGFGKLINTEIIQHDSEKAESIETPLQSNRIGIELRLDRPLCTAQPHVPDSNRFISEDFISGTIMKGAFARQFSFLESENTLIDELDFENIYFTHALPCDSNQSGRPLPLPLSLTTVDDQVIDMAIQSKHCLLLKKNEDKNEYIAPAFSPDWKDKDFKLVKKQLKKINFNPLFPTQRLLTVRTAIDTKTNTAAENKLFSLECVDNHIRNNQCDATKMLWRAEICLGKINEEKKEAITKKLTGMLVQSGLSDIGKTKAAANVSIYKEPFNESNLEPVDGLYYLIMLRTETRMLPCSHNITPTNGHQQLHQQYDDYFRYISGDNLTLSHFYAQQRLFGGDYYWQYYRKKTTEYRPEWLSVPGSVFVLKAMSENQGKIHELLSCWLETGLPVARDRQNDNWQTDPLIPQNGYGEIVINHEIHTVLAIPENGELV